MLFEITNFDIVVEVGRNCHARISHETYFDILNAQKNVKKVFDGEVCTYLDLRLGRCRLLHHTLQLIILVIVHGVVYAGDGHAIIHSRRVNARCERFLRHFQLGCFYQSLSRFRRFLASILQKLPNLRMTTCTSLPEIFTPFLQGFSTEWRLVCGSSLDPFARGLTLDNLFDIVVHEILN